MAGTMTTTEKERGRKEERESDGARDRPKKVDRKMGEKEITI